MGNFYHGLGEQLILVTRQLAWLWTAPRSAHPTKGQPKRPTRAEELRAAKVEPEMPHNPAPHIINRLMKIGPTQSNGMDREPISWAAIEAWKAATHTRLRTWEAELLRRLSVEYLMEARAAEDPYRPAPFTKKTITANDRQLEEDRLRMVLG